MTHLWKLKIPSLLKCVSLNVLANQGRLWNTPLVYSSIHDVETPIFCISRAAHADSSQIWDQNSTPNTETVARVSRNARAEAQAALLDYLHCTRCLQFTDAEHMSKNSPIFLEKLLKKVENEQEVGRSLTRFFRYHPINEFEPFFESIGLQHSEFSKLLPRDMMFLSDDDLLLENYHILCNYGIPRDKIGRIYKEALEVFRYDDGVLRSKLRAYEELGINRYSLSRFVATSPSLLVGGVRAAFVKVLEELKGLGMESDRILSSLCQKNSYNWSRIHDILCFFSKMSCNKEQLGELVRSNPGLLFEGSGDKTFSLIGLLLKLGSPTDEILSMFLQFPQVQVGTFVKNFRQGLLFLIEIEMEAEEILRIARGHALMLGSCSLKRPNSVLSCLNIGKKRLCRIIQESPQVLKKWMLGSKLDALPNSGEERRSLEQKTEFLLKLGFTKNSEEMKRALKVFRGKGGELQERFECFVTAGLDRNDVVKMIKISPQILNQSRDVIKMKIDFLVNNLGYPISSLVTFPSYIAYTIERVKLRFLMYNWLKDQGIVEQNLALSTIVACSDKIFIKQYVKHHPKGPEVWEKMKKGLSFM